MRNLVGGSSVYITNLDVSVNESIIEDLLSVFGYVMRIDMPLGTGMAIVRMSHPFESFKAAKALNGSTLAGQTIAVTNNPLDVV